MLPLIAGLLAASILSGRTISAIGRYKPFPIAGTAIATIGMFLLSRLHADTELWIASVYMLVLGVGIGLVMPVIVLAVQNDAPRRDVGVATSTATFFRSMGGSLGVALFGAIFAARLGGELTSLPADAAAHFSGGANMTPAAVHALPAGVRGDFVLAFVDALQPVFLVGAGVTALAFVLACLLKEIPLRATLEDTPGPGAEFAVAEPTVAAVVGAEPRPRAASCSAR
jgi:MFS family permease